MNLHLSKARLWMRELLMQGGRLTNKTNKANIDRHLGFRPALTPMLNSLINVDADYVCNVWKQREV